MRAKIIKLRGERRISDEFTSVQSILPLEATGLTGKWGMKVLKQCVTLWAART